jgi:hypothetical protein
MSSNERRTLLKSFLDEVFVPQRQRLLAYREPTNQSAQVDSDGYLAQMIAAIVLGVSGNFRRGKTGMHPGDLSDGTEIKSAYRAEQMNAKEDSHINFGSMSPERTREFIDRDRAVAVHTSYDVDGRLKIEVIGLDLRDAYVVQSIEEFLARSSAEKPQLQPRLYPDGKRDRLQMRKGGFYDLGATLLARAVVVGDEVDVDKWDPQVGVPLEECLDVHPNPFDAGAPHHIEDPQDPDEFFNECMIRHRRALIPYCEAARSSQNVGFGNLAQHLVSVVTSKRGSGSAARGFDLEDGSEVKLAMGHRGDPLGTEDFPRLNLQSNTEKILGWPAFYAVRIICEDEGLRVKVLEPEIEDFREQVRDYFAADSRHAHSTNMQYHSAPDFGDNYFTGERGDGSPRRLDCEPLYCAMERADGGCVRC